MLFFLWIPIVVQYNDQYRKNETNNLTNYNTFKLTNAAQFVSPDEIFCTVDNFYLTNGIVSIIFTYLMPFTLITFYNSRIVKTLNHRIEKRKEYFGKLDFKQNALKKFY